MLERILLESRGERSPHYNLKQRSLLRASNIAQILHEGELTFAY